MIETERLTLRGWRAEDVESFHAIAQNAEVMRHIGPSETRRESRRAWRRMAAAQARYGHCFWVVERKADNAFLGYCGLKKVDAEGTGLTGAVEYILPRRLTTVGAMVLVAYAVGVSTVLFQTVTGNRILTPSIMGFDALYVLIQTVMVWVFTAQSFLGFPPAVRFLAETVLMVVFAVALYRWLFTGAHQSLHLVLLIGIVFATLFRGISALLQKLMEPSEFTILQDLRKVPWLERSVSPLRPGPAGYHAVVAQAACSLCRGHCCRGCCCCCDAIAACQRADYVSVSAETSMRRCAVHPQRPASRPGA